MIDPRVSSALIECCYGKARRQLIAALIELRNAAHHPVRRRRAFSLLSKNCCIRIAMSFWFARLAGLWTSLL